MELPPRAILAFFLAAGCAVPPSAPGPAREHSAFATGSLCARCHSASPRANALRNALGDDVSPHGLWQGSLMANALHDPYFRAQLAREQETRPAEAAAIEGLCLRCHAPMAHHQARLDGRPAPRLAELAHDPLAQDGVSCTVCHQAQPENLGRESSFSGQLAIRDEQRIFGPYPDPVTGPMRMQTGFTPEQGAHVQASALCGACHTLTTQHAAGAEPFFEQTPYLEWRNSVFSDEQGASAESRTCQQCHMPDEGTTRIARNPGGRDFNLAPRPNVRAHAFHGGNAYMLDLLRTHAAELGVRAPAAALERAAAATRRQLAQDTGRVEIRGAARAGRALSFDVHVQNLTGHKFPAGYPSRRAWLAVEVRNGGRTLFESGASDERGRLIGVADERELAHHDVVRDQAQVVVYESRAVDAEGRRTTQLSRMARLDKDTRLLPRGWSPTGPDAEHTRPLGTGGDPDFAGGGDVVHFRLELPSLVEGRVTLVATLLYQTIPPPWAEDLRGLAAPEARRFLELYESSPHEPETIALAVEFLE